MTKPKRIFLDTDMGQMHVRVSRPGHARQTPLVCLHMTPQSGRYFSSFMEAMSEDRAVVAPDYHGYGESDLPPENPVVTIEDYARTNWQAIDALEIGQVDLLGHHTGAKVAIEMAHQRPASVRTIVFMSALLQENEGASTGKDIELAPIDESGDYFFQIWNGIKKHRGPGMTLDAMASSFAEAIRNGAAASWGYRAAAAYNREFRHKLSESQHRVVVFNPGDDLYEHTPRVTKYLRHGVLIDKPEWGHGLWDAFTDDVTIAVRSILSGPVDAKSARSFAAAGG